jgi:hypothetical protein
MRITGRCEKRVPMTVPIYLTTSEETGTVEKTFTENISPHGARVVTQKPLKLGERPTVHLLTEDSQSRGHVVYCQPLPSGRFCVGLEFPGYSTMWGINKRTSPHEPRH